MDRVSYSMFPFWRPIVFVFFGVLALGGVLGFTTGRLKASPEPWFTVAWFLILFWNAYWFLFRISYRIEMQGNQIRWFTPLRRGQFALDDLVSIRSSPLNQLSVFKRRSGPSVIMTVQRGLSEFTDEVRHRAPRVSVRAGLYGNPMRTSLRDGFKRETSPWAERDPLNRDS